MNGPIPQNSIEDVDGAGQGKGCAHGPVQRLPCGLCQQPVFGVRVDGGADGQKTMKVGAGSELVLLLLLLLLQLQHWILVWRLLVVHTDHRQRPPDCNTAL